MTKSSEYRLSVTVSRGLYEVLAYLSAQDGRSMSKIGEECIRKALGVDHNGRRVVRGHRNV